METNNTQNISTTYNQKEKKGVDELRDEKYLTLIANIILVVGIVASLILLFSVVFVTGQQNYYSSEGDVIGSGVMKAFSATGLAITLATLISTVTLWAFLRVISNISVTLKEIKGKIQTNSIL
jgi:hypothetical protein